MSLWESVGETPLIRIQSLSKKTGCEIYGKAEFLNPGGSVKDRAAKGIIEQAEKEGALQPGGTIVEGTAGNTGIALAMLGRERGYKIIITMPSNQSEEKFAFLQALGADVRAVPPCPFKDPNHFYHQARRIAETTPGAFWANQFENTANAEVHYRTTGPEIWRDMDKKVDVFCSAVGTGGTIGGVSSFLKDQDPRVRVILADPYGSGMYSYVKTGKIETEGSSVTEGIGIMRLTANFSKAVVDEAVRVSDTMMMETLYHLASQDGLVIGPSAALNVRAAYEWAKSHKGSGQRIVTILCDHGTRYQSRIFNPDWLKEKGLHPVEPLN